MRVVLDLVVILDVYTCGESSEHKSTAATSSKVNFFEVEEIRFGEVTRFEEISNSISSKEVQSPVPASVRRFSFQVVILYEIASLPIPISWATTVHLIIQLMSQSCCRVGISRAWIDLQGPLTYLKWTPVEYSQETLSSTSPDTTPKLRLALPNKWADFVQQLVKKHV